ncbi:hypothetical protein [Stappia indica]|uniref:hypothetical protein n=1 Tax=Stappia indica TaxID=538381 RepID=UPI001CD4D79A|nr:hypothetical protein [Stappia indica]MCA1298509.1 hypothetical protein [Stappia indica]
MNRALIEVNVPPFRMLKKSAAASYCGMAAKAFEGLCPVTAVEMPNGLRLWDARDLDAWLDGLKAGDADSDDAILDKLG